MRSLGALALVVLVSSGCSDDDPPRRLDDAAVGDAGPRDSGSGGDSATPDSGSDDPDAGDVSVRCELGAAVDVLTASGTLAELEIDLAAGATNAMVAARVFSVDDAPQQYVDAVLLTPTSVGTPAHVAGIVSSTSRLPAVAPRGTGFLVGWSDNNAGNTSFELYTRAVDGAGAALGSAAARATTVSADDSLDLVAVGDATLFAWLERSTPAKSRIGLLSAAEDFSPSATDVTATAGFAQRPRLATFGGSVYAAFRGASNALRVSKIAADATSASASNVVSTVTTVSDHWDIAGATAAAEGAVVFEWLEEGVRSSVSFRYLDANGAAPLAEPVLSGLLDQGASPAIAPLGGGYLVAYRHRTEAGVITIRVLLVDAFGAIVDSDDSDPITDFEGDVALATTPTGQPYLVYEATTTATIPGQGSPSPAAVLRSIPITCGEP